MKLEFVRQGEFMLLQFNSSCDEALPACQAMCCRMRRYYNVGVTAEEALRFKTQTWADGQKILEQTADGDCVYLEGNRCSIYHDRPESCRNWHCSPGGGLTDPAITKRENGWVLFPAREAHA